MSPVYTPDADVGHMASAEEHIYSKTCEECDRPALTFDRGGRAFCPSHSSTVVMVRPVKSEILLEDRLLG